MTPPVALTIAGSDSGGGAGIQADLKSFAALGVFGTSAITAVTAQNTTAVKRVDLLPVEAVEAQIDAVLADLPVAAVKTGMLATAAIVELVARRAAAGDLPHLVVDPVMVASSGDRLLDEDAESAYRELLFPHAEVITPNLLEASVLLGRTLRTADDALDAAFDLAEPLDAWVVVKGGHLSGSAVDVVVHGDDHTVLRSDRVDTANVHGTGCSFASATAAGLASGLDPMAALRQAKALVDRGLRGGATWRLGSGHGPIDHFGWGRAPVISAALAIGALVVVLGGLVVVALGAGGTEDVDRYFTARDSQTVGRLSLAFLASGLGSWILFAPPEVGAQVGILGVVGYAVGGALPFVAYAWIGPRIRAAAPEGVTLTDWVRLRFGRSAQAWVAAVSIFYMFMFITAELTGIGAVFEILAGVDPWVPIVLVAAVTAAYTAYGGLPASLRTDQVQAVMILGLVAITVGAIVLDIDEPVARAVDGGLDTVSRAGWESIVVLGVAIVAANLFHQGYWQRTWAAADARTVTRAGWGAAGLTMLVLLAVGATGLVAAGIALAAGEPPPAVPFFTLLTGLPEAVVLVALVLAVALVASSVDTLQSALAAVLSQDLSDRRLSVNGARVARALLTVPAALIALEGHDVLRLFLIADLVAAATVGPVFLGLRPRATGRGVILGSAAGLAGVVAYGTIQSGSLIDGFEVLTLPNGLDLGAFFWAPVVSTATALAVAALTPRPAAVS